MPGDDSNSKEQMKELREWLKTQSQIPEIDDLMLLRFLHSCYYDVQATKKCIELFHNIRASCPKVFNNRDPMSEDSRKLFKISYSVFLTNGKDNVRIWQLNDPGMNNYDHPETTKGFMMMTDVSFIEEKHMPERDVVILDCKDVSLKFLTKVNLSVLRASAQYLQDALPVRLRQVHIINAPSFIDKLYAVVKPLLNKDVIQMIHFHKPNSETIFEYVDKNVIPEDYAGTAPSMRDLMTEWVGRMEKQREFLTDDTAWRTIGSKTKYDEPVNASFKSLAID